MLVIGRRPGEGLTVLHKGEVLKLSVWLEDHHIKVGLDAPHSFEVLRNEIWLTKHEDVHRPVQRDRRVHARNGMGGGLADGSVRGARPVLPDGPAEALANGADSR
jgi:sRNA-binding carbon storage regulator CsrA